MARVTDTSSPHGDAHCISILTAHEVPWFDDLRCARAVTEEIIRCDQDGLLQSLAWTVLADRVMWLIRRRETDLNTCMARFKDLSARAVQCTAERSARIWQAGYHDRVLTGEENLIELARHLVHAPIRARLAERLEQYPHWYCRWPMATGSVKSVEPNTVPHTAINESPTLLQGVS